MLYIHFYALQTSMFGLCVVTLYYIDFASSAYYQYNQAG